MRRCLFFIIADLLCKSGDNEMKEYEILPVGDQAVLIEFGNVIEFWFY